MSASKKYMAASVPRFLRTSRLNYLPPNALIGSRITRGDSGVNLIFDVVMLPMHEFHRMRTNVGLQHVVSPMPKLGPTFNAGFVLADAKEVTVPAGEADPEAYARNYFMIQFSLVAPGTPETQTANTLPVESVPAQPATAKPSGVRGRRMSHYEELQQKPYSSKDQ